MPFGLGPTTLMFAEASRLHDPSATKLLSTYKFCQHAYRVAVGHSRHDILFTSMRM